MPQVLVVEDDAPIASMIADELEDHGYAVQVAPDGQQALQRVARRRPDAIVLDLMLPVLHGWEFVERYREHTNGEEIPIVVVSAAGAVPRSMEALGVRHFVPKPFAPERLAACVDEVVQRRSEHPKARRSDGRQSSS
jgi:two-component system, OmpR family, phosphate regulon response regulator PhoB